MLNLLFSFSFGPRADARKPDPSRGRINVQERNPSIQATILDSLASGDGQKIGESMFSRKTKAVRSSHLAF